MRIQVVTTLNKKLYNSYAKKFFETYNWPFDLTVYSEDMLDIPNTNIIVRSIYDEVPSCQEFVERNKHRMAITEFKKKFVEINNREPINEEIIDNLQTEIDIDILNEILYNSENFNNI